MNLEKYVISFVVFSVMMVSGVLMIADINREYDTNMDYGGWNGTYNAIDDMYDLSEGMKDHTLEGELSEDEAWESSVKGSYSAARRIKATFHVVGNFTNDLATEVHVPAVFIQFGLIAVALGVLFGIISLVMRFKW